jgi:soluble lytic murein transglycosylase-like protein
MLEILAAIYINVGIYAKQYKIDPNLVMAIIEVESDFNPKATGLQGEVGLMQLHPRYFPRARYDIKNNIKIGIKHLAYMRKHCPYKRNHTWVVCYNRGFKKLDYPHKTSYYKKVMTAYKRRR